MLMMSYWGVWQSWENINIVVNFKVMKIKFINIKSLNILWYEMYQGQ